MKITTSAGIEVDVSPVEILRAAGVIYASRRRTHGHPPLRVFKCHWCDCEVRGRGPLEQHERSCSQRASGSAFNDADLIAFTHEDLLALSL